MSHLPKILLAIVIAGAAFWAGSAVKKNQPAPATPNTQTPGQAENPGQPDNSYKDLIKVDSPKAEDVVTSPLKFTGEARGNWYFEATFPVRLLDRNGTELGVGYAQATKEWMTTEYVPFEGQIEFKVPETSNEATLIFEKANASGLPENEDEYKITVRFAR